MIINEKFGLVMSVLQVRFYRRNHFPSHNRTLLLIAAKSRANKRYYYKKIEITVILIRDFPCTIELALKLTSWMDWRLLSVLETLQ